MWTAFDYMYRDAGNFKALGTVALEGGLSERDQDLIRSRLQGGEFFIAEQVGVPPLYEQLYRWSGGITNDDHCWHEIVGFREMPDPENGASPILDASELVKRFARIDHWDENLSPHSQAC